MVRRLYDVASRPGPFQTMAKQKLQRWGFNFERACCLLTGFRNVLVRMPGRDAVFPCVDFRDALHGILMFLSRVLMEGIDYIPFTPAQRRVLDQRLALLGNSHYFRDPNGVVYRSQKSIFSDVGMTAHDRCQLLFFLPHVLGPVAEEILPDRTLYLPLMTAIARAQLIVIVVRGLRSYTQPELRDIFDLGYLHIFGSLQRVRQISYELRLRRHEQQPRKFKKPADPCDRPDRATDESETEDTDDEFDLYGFLYSHGELSLIHQHWVLQAILAGSFSVYCTLQSAEAAHKKSAKLAASRVRHLKGM